MSLLHLQLILREGGAELTLYLHHCMADGHHGAVLVDELFSRYTDAVTTGDPGPITPQPTPLSMEAVLAQRGIRKQGLSGAERFMSVMYAYEIPATETPAVLAHPGLPQAVPVTRLWLSKQQTSDLMAFGREHRLSLNAVVAAAILLTEWQLRNTPHVPIPYVYPVDLRFVLAPQWPRQKLPISSGRRLTSLRSGRIPTSWISQAISLPHFGLTWPMV